MDNQHVTRLCPRNGPDRVESLSNRVPEAAGTWSSLGGPAFTQLVETPQPLTTRELHPHEAHRDTCICHRHQCQLRNHNGHFTEEPTCNQKLTQHCDSIHCLSTPVSLAKSLPVNTRLSRTGLRLHLHHCLPHCATTMAFLLFEGLQAKSTLAQHLTNSVCGSFLPNCRLVSSLSDVQPCLTSCYHVSI